MDGRHVVKQSPVVNDDKPPTLGIARCGRDHGRPKQGFYILLGNRLMRKFADAAPCMDDIQEIHRTSFPFAMS
jgi:hypothetical protein